MVEVMEPSLTYNGLNVSRVKSKDELPNSIIVTQVPDEVSLLRLMCIRMLVFCLYER